VSEAAKAVPIGFYSGKTCTGHIVLACRHMHSEGCVEQKACAGGRLAITVGCVHGVRSIRLHTVQETKPVKMGAHACHSEAGRQAAQTPLLAVLACGRLPSKDVLHVMTLIVTCSIRYWPMGQAP
jgi:hypothetical protein